MLFLDRPGVERVLSPQAAIEALRQGFAGAVEAPLRHHHPLPASPASPAGGTLLLMPAWPAAPGDSAPLMGVKVVGVFPDNPTRAESVVPGPAETVSGIYYLADARSGAPRAVLDGGALTRIRTAAASALAADYLAPRAPETLLVVGTGALAPWLIRCHRAVRPYARVRLYGRDPAKAQALCDQLAGEVGDLAPAGDLQAAVGAADVISVATTATRPVVLGDWLRPGQHLDLVGAFRPDMRETDDQAMRRARVFIDTDGALKESGEMIEPLASGALSREAIQGNLFGLCRGAVAGRGGDEEITLFKSVGTALEDLAAAAEAYRLATSQE
ncbi:ornithine cyclodeaminase family protein [Roseospirillum parvum]|uniref:Ornithine cyclodeaminase n=1 Tax=Roseospirillum parvum TaxID=83401 RepID=A0A1G7ZSZ3_9PROT|nr:ornithine cyclodeaminase family protein [Roseospirillum parvum]SDH11809.1 ornithine cyclodeaminase [Roseospirillum parvum]